MRRLASGKEVTALLVGAGGTAKAAIYALCKAKGVKKPILVYNRTASRGQALAEEFGATFVSSLEGLSDVGVIVSTIPPEGHEMIPSTLLAGNPIMLDASYMPGGAPLTKRAVEAGMPIYHDT
jgi:shikimate 5-dehydrogenase